jgi:methylated-DNA-[protein]-cysteine S-methyltransferase
VNAHAVIDSPIGPLYLEASPRGLHRLAFGSGRKFDDALSAAPDGPADPGSAANLDEAVRQLDDYFAGRRTDFDLALDLEGTEFRQKVWQAIAAIPYSETISYAELAASAGSPNAYRAAGAACGANPVAIVVPCHRVVGSDKGLHGFGGGLPTKRWLLDHEASTAMASAATKAASAARQPVLV